MRASAGRRGAARLAAEDLFDFDQDHSGGVAAVAVLARRAGMQAGSRVLDVCAGLAGPARFLASRRPGSSGSSSIPGARPARRA